jgi:hypothetical protein
MVLLIGAPLLVKEPGRTVIVQEIRAGCLPVVVGLAGAFGTFFPVFSGVFQREKCFGKRPTLDAILGLREYMARIDSSAPPGV